MDSLIVSTEIHVPPEDVYDFLMDFEGYAHYSEYVKDVYSQGDGGVGTQYGITLSWWKLTYTARSRVTDIDEPNSIEWEVIKDLDANGDWNLEPIQDGESTRVTLEITFYPSTANAAALKIPKLVPMGKVIDKARGFVVEESERVLRRVVHDLEGERRPVSLTIHETPTSV